MASLIEREAIEKDFGKVSRVTYNRLAQRMQLQYDSTVNYVLDRPTIRTKAADREQGGPVQHLPNTGLPPTPISAPSPEAIKAAAAPTAGKWLYFVRCQKDGTSCFADDARPARQEHRSRPGARCLLSRRRAGRPWWDRRWRIRCRRCCTRPRTRRSA